MKLCNPSIFFILSLFLSFISATVSSAKSGGYGAKWGYSGKIGPDNWGDLSSDYSTCKNGSRQSPIDITGAVSSPLDDIIFHYEPSSYRIVNNGHTIQVNYEKGSFITVNNKRYQLIQFHFHSPSEHKIDGNAYDMVAHLVHKGDDGELAVIAIFFEQGKKNYTIEALWNNLPAIVGKEKVEKDIRFNVKFLLPFKKNYYTYSGSLTTPPCSEGVLWLIMKTPVTVSQEQIAGFTHFFNKSVRPVQPVNSRTVMEKE